MKSTSSPKQNIARALLLQLMLYLFQGILLSSVSAVVSNLVHAALIIKLLSILTSVVVFLLPLLLYLKSTHLNFSDVMHPFSLKRGNSQQNTNDNKCYEAVSSNLFKSSPPIKCLQSICAVSILLTTATFAGWVTNQVAQSLGENFAASQLPSDIPLLAISFISSVIVSPIIEELLFRGAVINSAAQFGRPTAIAISAFTFALMHYSAYKFFYALCAGAVIAYFTVKINSVPFAILLHSANNLITFIFSLILSASEQLYDWVFIIFLSVAIPLALLGIVALVYEYRVAQKNSGSRQKPKNNTTESFITPELIVYVAFSLALMLL